ncbi:hypothetical protein A6F55_24040 [Prescottella equi]|nr:hypothetical protein A6F55_24040 [Prescottella equi]
MGGAVVGHYAHAVVGEPGDRTLKDTDDGGWLLVGMYLGVGETGAIVDGAVRERDSDPRFVAVVALAGPVRGGFSLLLTLPAAAEGVSTPVGDVSELGDVDVDQRPGVGMLVASQRFPVTRSVRESQLIRHRTSTACTIDAGIDSRPEI